MTLSVTTTEPIDPVGPLLPSVREWYCFIARSMIRDPINLTVKPPTTIGLSHDPAVIFDYGFELQINSDSEYIAAGSEYNLAVICHCWVMV
jgi:hypothetical protein